MAGGNGSAVGYIGLGNMGIGMAGNLLSFVKASGAGESLVVFNRTASKAEPLIACGAEHAESLTKLAQRCHMVFSCLWDDEALKQVFAELAVSSPGPGFTLVDSTTVRPSTVRELAAAAKTAGIAYVSAPVFGRPPAAAAKQLVVVMAGEPSAKERARPYLAAMGRALFDMGDEPHLANIAKLSGNFYILSVVELISEGLALAEKNGVPRRQMSELAATLFPGPITSGYAQRIGAGSVASSKEDPGFSVEGGRKDVGYMLSLAAESGVQLPIAELVSGRLDEFAGSGKSEGMSFEGMSTLVFEKAGLPPLPPKTD